MIVRTTSSPHEALEWLRRGDPFDAAVVDFMMPHMDGGQFAKKAAQLWAPQALPLIFYLHPTEH